MTTIPRIPGETEIDRLGREYIQFRSNREELTKAENQRKASLMDILSECEPTDEKGNVVVSMSAKVGDVTGFKRERRVSNVLDQDAAAALVEKYGLEDDCYETITVLNEDALLGANFAGKISDEEIASLYTQKETFAFIMVKDK